jgi:tRNA A-37 threonylcarbamoyl transferase component Bud32
LKVAPCGSCEADSLAHEGGVYIRLKPLWDVTVPRLMACGPDGEEHGYLLATRLVPNSRHFDPATDEHLIPQLWQALRAVHDRGVVHDDLRWPNILVQEGVEGQQQAVWLIDFGHAKMDGTQQEKDDEMHDLSLMLGSAG